MLKKGLSFKGIRAFDFLVVSVVFSVLSSLITNITVHITTPVNLIVRSKPKFLGAKNVQGKAQ